jgi:hypothetical protein
MSNTIRSKIDRRVGLASGPSSPAELSDAIDPAYDKPDSCEPVEQLLDKLDNTRESFRVPGRGP